VAAPLAAAALRMTRLEPASSMSSSAATTAYSVVRSLAPALPALRITLQTVWMPHAFTHQRHVSLDVRR